MYNNNKKFKFSYWYFSFLNIVMDITLIVDNVLGESAV
jgi:hypothetical protein